MNGEREWVMMMMMSFICLLKDLAEGRYKTKHPEADQAHYTDVFALPYLCDAVVALVLSYSS